MSDCLFALLGRPCLIAGALPWLIFNSSLPLLAEAFRLPQDTPLAVRPSLSIQELIRTGQAKHNYCAPLLRGGGRCLTIEMRYFFFCCQSCLGGKGPRGRNPLTCCLIVFAVSTAQLANLGVSIWKIHCCL